MNKIEWSYYYFSIKDILSNPNKKNEDENDDDDAIENRMMSSSRIVFPNEMVSTPIGLIPLNRGWNPIDDRDMYIADTNFTLTANDIKKITIIPGIENISVISQYSFAIIIGRLFNKDEVFYEIEKELSIGDEKLSELLDKNSPIYDTLYSSIKDMSQHKHWLIYIFPNGNVYKQSYDDEDVFKEELKFLRGDEKTVGLADFSEGLFVDSSQTE